MSTSSEPSTSSFPLMAVYTVIALALQAVSMGVIILIEPYIHSWSGVVFMTSYLLAFWVAWVIAVRVTEPKAEVPAAEPSRA